MRKLLPVVFLLCIAGAWASAIMRGQGPPKEYTEYLLNAEAAYNQGYYVETLEWIQKAGGLSAGRLPYDAEQRKRDAYYNTGDMDSYAAQCRHLIKSFPEQEENYVKLMEYYRDNAEHGSVYRLIDGYAGLWPGNGVLRQIQDEYDRMHGYYNMGYFDVQYASGSLVDIQRMPDQAVADSFGDIPPEDVLFGDGLSSIEDALLEDAPVGDSPADDAPVGDNPADGATVEDSTVDGTAVEDSTADGAPVGDSPVDGTAVGDSTADGAPFGDTSYLAMETSGRELCGSRGDVAFGYGYSQISVASDGRSYFIKDDKGVWTRVDPSNNLLAKNDGVQFDEIGRLSTSGIATAVIGGRPHFIDKKMQVLDAGWEDAGTFSEGINAVKRDGKWALVTDGDWEGVSEFPYTDVPRSSMGYCVMDGLGVVADKSGYYIIDTKDKNKAVTENRYEELKAFEDSQPTAYRSGDRWGFVDRGGEICAEARYEDAMPYKNGYAAVKKDGLWGYIDRNGKMVVEPEFQEALPVMPDGVAYVKNEAGSWDYVVIYKLRYKNV